MTTEWKQFKTAGEEINFAEEVLQRELTEEELEEILEKHNDYTDNEDRDAWGRFYLG